MKKLIILIFLIITKAGITQNNESLNLIAAQIEELCSQIDSSCKKIEIVNMDAGGAFWWLDTEEPYNSNSLMRGRLRKITQGWGDIDASYEQTFYIDHCGNIIYCKNGVSFVTQEGEEIYGDSPFEKEETITYFNGKKIIKKIQKKYFGNDYDNWSHPEWQEVIVTYPNSAIEYENYDKKLRNSILESTVINFSRNCDE